MCIERVSNTELAILIETDREDPARFSEEQTVELPTGHLLDVFAIEVLLLGVLGVQLFKTFDFRGFLVHVKDFTVDCLDVLVLAKLKPRVFPHAKCSTIVTPEQAMLKTC